MLRWDKRTGRRVGGVLGLRWDCRNWRCERGLGLPLDSDLGDLGPAAFEVTSVVVAAGSSGICDNEEVAVSVIVAAAVVKERTDKAVRPFVSAA